MEFFPNIFHLKLVESADVQATYWYDRPTVYVIYICYDGFSYFYQNSKTGKLQIGI